jgi:hypothetical protein
MKIDSGGVEGVAAKVVGKQPPPEDFRISNLTRCQVPLSEPPAERIGVPEVAVGCSWANNPATEVLWQEWRSKCFPYPEVKRKCSYCC